MAAPHELKGQFKTLRSFIHGEGMAVEKYHRARPGKLAEKRKEIEQLRHCLARLEEMPTGGEYLMNELRMFLDDKAKHFRNLQDYRWRMQRLEEHAGAARALAAVEQYWKQAYPELVTPPKALPQPWYTGF